MNRWCKILNLITVAILITSGEVQANEPKDHFISGQLNLDNSWNRVVYLSHIPTFADMYRMSSDMIIEKATLDASGHFKIKTGYLPVEDQLYRIHLSKKNDPPASLIIGGQDENHIFVITGRNSDFEILGKGDEGVFRNIAISGSAANRAFQVINEAASYLDSGDFSGSSVKREFITKAIYEKLRFMADTSTHPLTSLYAIYSSNFESNHTQHPEYYEAYLKKWRDEKSSYFTAFRNQIPLPSSGSKDLSGIAIALGFLIIGLAIGWFVFSRKKKTDPLVALSVQERKVFEMIQNGSSNKEISEEFNIGLSTVKSHVSSIYAKLEISSRKEAMNLK